MALRRLITTSLIVLVAALVAAGCGEGKNGGVLGGGIPDNAFCTVRGDALSKKSLERLFSSAEKRAKLEGSEFPKKGTDEYDDLRSQAINYLIEKELFEQEAEEQDINVTEKEIDKKVEEIKKGAYENDEDRYQAELKKQGLTEDELRDLQEQQLIAEALFEKVTKDVEVSDADAERNFEQNQAQYVTPESRKVAHILVKTKAQADRLYAQVASGNRVLFSKLAKQFSQDDGSKNQGGVLTIQKGQTVPPFDKAAFALGVGDVSRPVKTEFGFHVIIALGAVVPEKKQAFADVEKQIKDQLVNEERSERMTTWQKELREDAEEDVSCRKGFVWTQTASSDTDGGETGSGDTAPETTDTSETTETGEQSDTGEGSETADPAAGTDAGETDAAGAGDTGGDTDAAADESGDTGAE